MPAKGAIAVRAGVGAAGVAVAVTGASSAAASTALIVVSGGAAIALVAIGWGVFDRLRDSNPSDRRRLR